MQRHEVLDLLLQLGIICLFADIGVTSRDGLDTRDIAVSDKIVAAKEVTMVLYSFKIISQTFSSTCTFKGEGDGYVLATCCPYHEQL